MQVTGNISGLLRAFLALLLATAAGIVAIPLAAPAGAAGAVAFDDFAGTVRGTRTVDTAGASSFSQQDGTGVVTLQKMAGNGSVPTVTLTYAMAPTDLKSTTNGQLFLDLLDIAGGSSAPGSTALTISAIVTDTSGRSSTYNSGIATTPSFGFVFNYDCTDGQSACFKGTADLGNITTLTMMFMHGSGNADAPAVTFRIAGITSTPLGGARPAAPEPVLASGTTVVVGADGGTATFDIIFRSGASVASLAELTAPTVTVTGASSASAVVAGPSTLRVTASLPADTGTRDLVVSVPAGAATDTWGQPSTAASLNLRVRWAAAPSWNSPALRGILRGTAIEASWSSWTQAQSETTLDHTLVGALPPGLSLAADGTMSGVPTVVGEHAFTVRARDSFGVSRERTFTLDVAAPTSALAVDRTVLLGSGLDHSVEVAGVASDAHVALDPAIPGVTATRDEQTVRLAGLIADAGAYESDLVISRTIGPDTIVTGRSPVRVRVGAAPAVSVEPPRGLRVGYPADVEIAAAEDNDAAWVVGGSVPGMQITSTTGSVRLTGTPTTVGSTTITVQRQNIYGATTFPVEVVVAEAPRPVATITPVGGASQAVDLSGGRLEFDVEFAIDDVPVGVSGVDTGDFFVTGAEGAVLSVVGSGSRYTVAVDVTRWTGSSVTLSLRDGGVIDGHGALNRGGSGSVAVHASPLWSVVPPASQVRIGTPVSLAFAATGLPAPTLSTSSPLPDGVTWTSGMDGTGSLAGTPTQSGVFDVVVAAANGHGVAPTTVRLEVVAPRATTVVTPVGGPSQTVGEGATVSFDVVQDADGQRPDLGADVLTADDVTTSGVDIEHVVVATTTGGYRVDVTIAQGATDGELVVALPDGATVDRWGIPSLAGSGAVRLTIQRSPTPEAVVPGGSMTGAGTLSDPFRVSAGGAVRFGVEFAGSPVPTLELASVTRVPFAGTEQRAVAARGAGAFGEQLAFALPAPTLSGFALADHGDGTGTVTGTPSAAGTYDVVVRATNPVASVVQSVRIVVAAADVTDPVTPPTDVPSEEPSDEPSGEPSDETTDEPLDEGTDTPDDGTGDDVPDDVDTLPVTGAQVGGLFGVALLLVAGGALALAWRRRLA